MAKSTCAICQCKFPFEIKCIQKSTFEIKSTFFHFITALISAEIGYHCTLKFGMFKDPNL